MRTERQDHHATLGELLDQRLGHGFGGRGDDDAIERRALRDAGETVADPHLDIVIAERRQPLRARLPPASDSVRR